MSVRTAGAGVRRTNPLVLLPSMYRTWPMGGMVAGGGGDWDVDVGGRDGERIQAHWSKVGDPQMNIIGRTLVGRLGKSDIETNQDQLCQNLAATTADATHFYPNLVRLGAEDLPLAPGLRCYWVQARFRMASAGTPWGNRTGLLLRYHRVGVTFWTPEVGTDVDRAGFGLCGDGAGGWAFKAKQSDSGVNGPFNQTEALAWPVAVTDFLTCTFVVISATATRNASVQLWLGNELAIEESYDAAGVSLTLPSQVDTATLTFGPTGGLIHALGCAGSANGGAELLVSYYETGRGPVHPLTQEVLTGR